MAVVFTNYALDLKHIEGAVQVTALIKRHWHSAPPRPLQAGACAPSSGGKRISLSPMAYLFIEAQR